MGTDISLPSLQASHPFLSFTKMSTPVKLSTPAKGDATSKKPDLPFGLTSAEARVLLIGMACATDNCKVCNIRVLRVLVPKIYILT